jgi:hypothetical protein
MPSLKQSIIGWNRPEDFSNSVLILANGTSSRKCYQGGIFETEKEVTPVSMHLLRVSSTDK